MMIDRCYIEITNVCNLNCDFCPKHHRDRRQLTAEEFNLLTDRIRGKVCFRGSLPKLRVGFGKEQF